MRHQWSRAPLTDHFVYRLSVHLYVLPSVCQFCGLLITFRLLIGQKLACIVHRRPWPLIITGDPPVITNNLHLKFERKVEKVPRDVQSLHSQVKIQVWDKHWSQQVKHMLVPKWDGTRCPNGWASHVSMPNPSQMPYDNLS